MTKATHIWWMLTSAGYLVMMGACGLAAAKSFWCLPVGIVGAALFLYGSWRERRATTRG